MNFLFFFFIQGKQNKLFKTMKTITVLLFSLITLNLGSTSTTKMNDNDTFYDYPVKDIDGNDLSLEQYKGKLCLL